jgi:hypothetical protein
MSFSYLNSFTDRKMWCRLIVTDRNSFFLFDMYAISVNIRHVNRSLDFDSLQSLIIWTGSFDLTICKQSWLFQLISSSESFFKCRTEKCTNFRLDSRPWTTSLMNFLIYLKKTSDKDFLLPNTVFRFQKIFMDQQHWKPMSLFGSSR